MANKISKTKRERILKRDNYTCQICGKKVIYEGVNFYSPDFYNIDHIIPLSKGGKNSDDNLRVTCRKCNCSKGNRQLEDLVKNLIKISNFKEYHSKINDAISCEGLEKYLELLEKYKNKFNEEIEKEFKRVMRG